MIWSPVKHRLWLVACGLWRVLQLIRYPMTTGRICTHLQFNYLGPYMNVLWVWMGIGMDGYGYGWVWVCMGMGQNKLFPNICIWQHSNT